VPGHPETLSSLGKLADLYAERGDLEEAEETERQVQQGLEALRQGRELEDDDLVSLLDSRNRLGLVVLDQGRAREGLSLCEEAERTAKGNPGWENCPHTLSYTYSRALACVRLGRWEEAQRLFSDCLARQRAILGKDHLHTLRTEHGLADVLVSLGRYDEAQKQLQSILDRLGPGIREDHSFRGVVLVTLGKCFTGMGKYQEAGKALRAAHELLSKKFGAKHKYVREAAEARDELRKRAAEAGIEVP
jgi:tetratricopeptide (TPR) repeat protein